MRPDWRKSIFTLALHTCAWACLLAAPACRQTHPLPEEPGNIPGAQRPELPPAEQANSAEVAGTVLLTGLSIAGDLGVSAVGGFPDVGGGTGTTAPGVKVKILDPGHDILSQTVTGPDGTYKLSVNAAVVGTLQVEMLVTEDVNRDGAGGDTVMQVVPLNVKVGQAATVDFGFAYGAPASNAGGDLFPPDQSILTVDIFQEDLNGSRSDFLAQGPGGQLVIDKDGDHFLEPGDDAIYADANQNGMPETYEELQAPDSGSPGTDYVQGLVLAVNTKALTFTLETPDGERLTVALGPFAGVFPQEGPLGGYLGKVPFDASLVGRQVGGFGTREVERFVADMVLLFPLGDPCDPTGGGGGRPPVS
jgi:hypothetical protein